LACSRSGSARTRCGVFFLRDFDLDIGDSVLTVADSFIEPYCGVLGHLRDVGYEKILRESSSRLKNDAVSPDDR